jgi:membrane associated rhomboid family serine protease
MLLVFALSIIAQFDSGFLASRLSLIPSRVWLGEVWRVVTWPMVEPGAMGLILTLIVIWRFGTELAGVWGDARLQRFMVHVILGAGAATVLLAAAFGSSRFARLGGFAVIDALIIAWARQFPSRTLQLYGLITLSGRQLIGFTLAAAVVFAIYIGPLYMAPELAACAIAAWYPQAWHRR